MKENQVYNLTPPRGRVMYLLLFLRPRKLRFRPLERPLKRAIL